MKREREEKAIAGGEQVLHMVNAMVEDRPLWRLTAAS